MRDESASEIDHRDYRLSRPEAWVLSLSFLVFHVAIMLAVCLGFLAPERSIVPGICAALSAVAFRMTKASVDRRLGYLGLSDRARGVDYEVAAVALRDVGLPESVITRSAYTIACVVGIAIIFPFLWASRGSG